MRTVILRCIVSDERRCSLRLPVVQTVSEGAIQHLVSFVPKPGVTLLQMQLMDGAGRNVLHTAMNPLSLKYHGRLVCNLAGLSISDGTQILLAALATSGKSFHQ